MEVITSVMAFSNSTDQYRTLHGTSTVILSTVPYKALIPPIPNYFYQFRYTSELGVGSKRPLIERLSISA